MKSLLFALTSILLFASTGNPVEEYLSVEGPLNFNKTEFHLKWTDQPNEQYYIQEYLPKNESLENFNQMMTIHLFDTDISLKDAVGQKVGELTERKKSDPVCNFQVTKSPDGKEIIVDFLLGESKGDEMTVVEFNVYHYRQIDLSKKEKGIAVYAYSKRSYGDNITDFFRTLKDERNARLNEMISSDKPTIKRKKK